MVDKIVGNDTIDKSELLELVAYIEKAKSDISDVKAEEITSEHIPNSMGELDAVASHAETLTGALLDAAEALDKVANGLDDGAGDEVRGITAKMYEAANFHDITTQRIGKVVKALNQIEFKVSSILQAIGHDVVVPEEPPQSNRPITEEDLLNGPQLDGKGVSQDDVDAMFADDADGGDINQDDIDSLFDDDK